MRKRSPGQRVGAYRGLAGGSLCPPVRTRPALPRIVRRAGLRRVRGEREMRAAMRHGEWPLWRALSRRDNRQRHTAPERSPPGDGGSPGQEDKRRPSCRSAGAVCRADDPKSTQRLFPEPRSSSRATAGLKTRRYVRSSRGTSKTRTACSPSRTVPAAPVSASASGRRRSGCRSGSRWSSSCCRYPYPAACASARTEGSWRRGSRAG